MNAAELRPIQRGLLLPHWTAPRPRLKILFMCEAVSLAHVGRPLLLARWAREAGHEPLIACGPRFTRLVHEEGFEPLPLPTLTGEAFYGRILRGRFPYTDSEILQYVAAERKLLRDVSPHLVVSDFRLTAAISAMLAGLPLLSLINAYWSPGAECRFPAPDGLLPILPNAFRQRLFNHLRPLAFRCGARSLDRVRRSFGLQPYNDFRKHYTAGTWCAYADLPELAPVRAAPLNHSYIGPVIWEPRAAPPPLLGTLGLQRPLAYVSMGGSGNAGVLPGLLRALLAEDCDIALSGCSSECIDLLWTAMPELAGRCVAAPLFSPGSVLQRAALTVCHGGSGTIYQSLAAGVPLLCLPGNPDQCLASQGVQACGAALSIPRHRRGIVQLREHISMLIRRSAAAERARFLSSAINAYATRARWQALLKKATTTATRSI